METDITVNLEEAEKQWGDETNPITWRGHPIIEELYQIVCEDLEPWIKEHFGYDDLQEVYLGYIKDEDTFVMGWDAWRRETEDQDRDHGSVAVKFRLIENAENKGVHVEICMEDDHLRIEECPGVFYDRNDGFFEDYLLEHFPGLFHLRLD